MSEQNLHAGEAPAESDIGAGTPASPAPFDIEARLKTLPRAPGVYIMKDRAGAIIYVGKSVNLRQRVRSYFRGGDPRPFVRRLPRLLGDIETIVTETEFEALRLEASLIRGHRPRYNVALMDDSLWVRVDVTKAWPTVEVVRKVKQDGARYFGQYPSASAARRTTELINRNFLLRTCSDSEMKRRERPCIQYQIKRCLAPCVLNVAREKYMDHVQEATLFLEGKYPELKRRLEDRMWAASDVLAFEVAARYRDQLRNINAALERYKIVSTDEADQDAFGFYREGERVTIQVLCVRGGRLLHSHSHAFKDQAFPDDEVLSSFLNLFYVEEQMIPDQVLLPFWLEDQEALSELLSARRGAAVEVFDPSSGPRRKLVAMATKNATHTFRQQHSAEEQRKELMLKLKKRLGLSRLPRRMECFDISNLHGEAIVGAMAVFEDTLVAKREHRHFKIKGVEGQDDFASMAEMVRRRFVRALDGRWPMPDLVIIDGGKGQLSAAVAVLDELGARDKVDIISLAKARTVRGFKDDRVRHSLERVFLPGRKNPVILKQNSAEIFLLQRVRDEAHDVALAYHRRLRRKAGTRSSLENIPGVGPARSKLLLKHFGSLKAVRAASPETLAAIQGIGPDQARIIYAKLHPAPEKPS